MRQVMTAIFNKLTGSQFNLSIGGRVYKGRAPEDAVFPYAVYFLVSATAENTFREKLTDCLIQFSIFSSTSSSGEIEDLYSYLTYLYDDCTLSILGNTFYSMRRQNASLSIEDQTTTEGTVDIWHYMVEYSLLYQESV